jgi:hypothetical protein
LKAIGRHQSSNPILAGGLPVVAQVFMHTRNTDRTAAVLVDLADTVQKPLIVNLPSAR